MTKTTQPNVVPASSKFGRTLKALHFSLKYPRLTLQQVKETIKHIYAHGILKTSQVKSLNVFELIDPKTEAILSNFQLKEGNVSYYELLIISSLVAFHKPKVVLEIGTFNGNTTLQMALNAPKEAIIHTLDLPPFEVTTKEPILKSDLPFVFEKEKKVRKYIKSQIEHKIKQYLGDSTAYNFKLFTKEGLPEFVFIDGGHSYECVKSDTKKALEILAPGGIIIWHDFIPHYEGIYRYLHELSQELPLVHIKGTSLAYYRKETI